MADRKLIVTIVGDDRSLQQALTRSATAVNKFGATANSSLSRGGGFSRGLDDLLAKTRANIREAEVLADREARVGDAADTAAQKLQRAAAIGAGFFVLGRALGGAGAALAAFNGQATDTSAALEDAGGAIQSLITLDLGGFFEKTQARQDRLRDSLKELAGPMNDVNNLQNAQKAAAIATAAGLEDEAAAFEKAIQGARNMATAVAAVEFEQRKFNATLVDGVNRVVEFKGAVDDAGGLRGVGLAQTIEIPEPPTEQQRARRNVSGGANALLVAEAQGDLDAVLKLQRIARDRTEALTKTAKFARMNVAQRQEIRDQLARETAAVIGTEQQIKAQADAAARAAQLAEEAARREAEAARREALARAKALAERKAALEQARQFRLIGLDPGGGQVVPTIANLQKQLSQLQDNPALADAPAKLRNRLAGVEKALTDPLRKASVETRRAIAQLFDDIRGTFEKETQKGPLTKTTSLNANKLLDGLGLGRDLEKELRARLSSFNSAGLALAGNRGPTGSFLGNQPVVIENTTTVNLDGVEVGRSVTRQQQKGSRRNPKQKRGPNARSGI